MIETMVQGTVHPECIDTSACYGGNSSIQGNPKGREREMRVEVTYVFSKIFCISVYLTGKQPF
jgi:hypothetical protein